MVKEIRIYFEGDPELRSGFAVFFTEVREAARSQGIGFRLIAGEGHAVRDFEKALRTHPTSFNVLLLDAERANDGHLRQSLEERSDWPKGKVVAEDQVHFMVQVMGSWFLADQDALERYYGPEFKRSKLPKQAKVEAVDKDRVLLGLKEATAKTTKGAYHKTRHAPTLLELVGVQHVRRAASGCDRLFHCLLQRLQVPPAS